MILHIHCPCSCMNPQHNKPFSPWHKIRMLHLVEPHSPLHLNCMLMLHTLSTQDQQLPNPFHIAHQNFRNLITGSLHCSWNDHMLYPTLDKNTLPMCISNSQKQAQKASISFTLISRAIPFALHSPTNNSQRTQLLAGLISLLIIPRVS